MASAWPLVRLGDVLTRSEESTRIHPDKWYQQVTVRLWGAGVVLRNRVSGADIAAKRRLVVRANQFILSRIDARNGAFGLVPDSLDGAVVSNDFPSFSIDVTRIAPRFLEWMSKTQPFVGLCRAASEGTTNRVRLKVDRFLASEVSLPSVDEQQRIVSRIEELASLIDEAQALRAKAREETEKLRGSLLYSVVTEQATQPGDWPSLSTVVERIENGWSPACLPYPADEGVWGVLKVGAISTGRFLPEENKTLPTHLEPRPELEIRHGDFLMNRANTRKLVGACAVVQNPPRRLLLCDKIFRFVFRPDVELDRFYLSSALKSPQLREQIETVASGTSSSMKNISKAKVMRLRVPLPPIEVQQRVVAYLNRLEAYVDDVRALQDGGGAESDALLLSILDKAFKGEL